MVGVLAAASVGFAITAAGALAATPSPPFAQCPTVAADSGCQYLIAVTDSSSGQVPKVYADPAQPFYDEQDDALVGVQNDSNEPLASMHIGVLGSGDNSFGFDGDGMCNQSPSPPGCSADASDPSDYAGTGVTLTADDGDSGTVSFTPALSPGQSTYFTLESNPSQPVIAGNGNDFLTLTLQDGAGNSSDQYGNLAEDSPTDITATATLVGGSGSPGGSVTYGVYSDPGCTNLVASAGQGSPSGFDTQFGASSPAGASLANNAVYYWQATYSGDGTSDAYTTPCGSAQMTFGNPPGNSTTSGCDRHGLGVGVVSICADTLSGSGNSRTASGNVVLDGGVSVGDGPISIDLANQKLTSSSSVPIATGSGATVLSATIAIDGKGTTDPVSGDKNVAAITLSSVSAAALSLGGAEVQYTPPSSGPFLVYLDPANGGQLDGTATMSFKLGPTSVSGSFGLSAGSSGLRVLGGAINIGAVQIAPGWKLNSARVSYQSGPDQWQASGSLSSPLGDLDLSGTLIDGKLDAVRVVYGSDELNIPVFDTGFFLNELGGGVQGLVDPPLQVSAIVGGYWGVPKASFEPLWLKDVTLTYINSGKVTLDGDASLGLKDHSPVTGSIALGVRFQPLLAYGDVKAKIALAGVISGHGDLSAAFTTSHFTAQGSGSFSIPGLSGNGSGVLSDKGVGASGKLCHDFVVKKVCAQMSFAAPWQDIRSRDFGRLWNDLGGSPASLVTATASAARPSLIGIKVARGQAVLLVETPTPHAVLIDPAGHRYTSTDNRHLVIASHLAGRPLSEFTVFNPRPGLWRVTRAPGSSTVHALLVPPQRPLVINSLAPTGSPRHRLARSRVIVVRWSSRGLPRGSRLQLTTSQSRSGLSNGTLLAARLGANGSLRLRAGRLARGRNLLALVVSAHGVPFETAVAGPVVWRS